MATMTVDDLRRILAECAGENEGDVLTGDILDASLEDLGYDSLALIETAARIKHEYQITIPDEQVTEMKTPRMVLDAVNAAERPGG